MMVWKRLGRTFFASMAAVLMLGGAAHAQSTPPAGGAAASTEIDGGTPTYVKAETPEQRMARIGTAEDPGPNPDPNKIWWRFGKEYRIDRYERRWAKYDQPIGYVRPFAMVASIKELYQHNDKYVWVWTVIDRSATTETAPAPEAGNRQWTEGDLQFLARIRKDFTPLTPAASGKVIRFAESSEGLPDGGSWRNGADVADMNGDGLVDLVVPPQRGAVEGWPTIFLGNGKGGWKQWESVTWPLPLDYGTVAAADFNGDKKMDLAFAVHLQGVRVFLGNGKGAFRDASQGLPQDFPTRRLIARDVDGDRDVDLVVISEGPTVGKSAGARLRSYLNDGRAASWAEVNVVDATAKVAGDFLSAGNFNGDKYPDFFTGSVYYNGMEVLHLSKAKGEWAPYASNGDTIPSLSYYFGNTAGKFSRSTADDFVISYIHLWPADLDPKTLPKPALENVANVDLLTWTKDGIARSPILRWDASEELMTALASADIDGDGNLDVMVTRRNPREATILLGDGKGGFTTAKVDGLTLSSNANYDVRLADVNGDRRPDVVLMYEANESTALSRRDGSVRVFLNRGAAKTEPVVSK